MDGTLKIGIGQYRGTQKFVYLDWDPWHFSKIYENMKTEDSDTGHFHNFYFQGVLRPYLQRSTA